MKIRSVKLEGIVISRIRESNTNDFLLESPDYQRIAAALKQVYFRPERAEVTRQEIEDVVSTTSPSDLRDAYIVKIASGGTDHNYLEGIERKKETYKKMGLEVVWIYGKDMFEMGYDNKPHKRKDFEKNLLRAIAEAARNSKKPGTKRGTLETNLILGYLYKHAA